MFSQPVPHYHVDRKSRRNRSIANLTLWTLQAWLAMFFIGAGFAKASEPFAYLEILLGWPRANDENLVHVLGWLEIALGLNCLSPLIFGRIANRLLLAGTVIIAILVMMMLIVHSLRLEIGAVTLNIALLVMALAVLVGRRRFAI